MSPFTTLFDFRQFQSGWWAGWAFLPVVAFAGWVVVTSGPTRRTPWGLVGPAWVLGSLLALDGWLRFDHLVDIPAQLLWGLLAVAAANELASHTPNPKILGCLLVLPGAYLVATSTDFGGPDWVVPLVTVTITLGAPMAADLDRRGARLGLGPVLWLITVFGVYVTVPDTELIRPLVGVAIPLALCGWPLRVARPRRGWRRSRDRAPDVGRCGRGLRPTRVDRRRRGRARTLPRRAGQDAHCCDDAWCPGRA